MGTEFRVGQRYKKYVYSEIYMQVQQALVELACIERRGYSRVISRELMQDSAE